MRGFSPLKIPRWRMRGASDQSGLQVLSISDHTFFLFHGVLYWTQFVGGVRLRTQKLVWDWLTGLVLKWHILLLPVSCGPELRDRSILNWRRKWDWTMWLIGVLTHISPKPQCWSLYYRDLRLDLCLAMGPLNKEWSSNEVARVTLIQSTLCPAMKGDYVIPNTLILNEYLWRYEK